MTSATTDLSFRIAKAIRGNDGVRPNVAAIRRREDRAEIARELADDSAELAQLAYDREVEGWFGYTYDEYERNWVEVDEAQIWAEFQEIATREGAAGLPVLSDADIDALADAAEFEARAYEAGLDYWSFWG